MYAVDLKIFYMGWKVEQNVAQNIENMKMKIQCLSFFLQ